VAKGDTITIKVDDKPVVQWTQTSDLAGTAGGVADLGLIL